MTKKSNLEELVDKINALPKSKAPAKEVKLTNEVREVKNATVKKEETRSQSVQDQGWKKVGSLLRTAAKPKAESVEEKTEQRRPIGQAPENLEQVLPPSQSKAPAATNEKSAYLPSQSTDKGPYALQEKEVNPYLPANTERNFDSTSFQKFEREVKLASHLASDRISEQEKISAEKVYDSLKSKDSKETQKYKRLERF